MCQDIVQWNWDIFVVPGETEAVLAGEHPAKG
jgi:hypothetical protein